MYIITTGAHYELSILGYVETEQEAIKICDNNRIKYQKWCEYKKQENELTRNFPKYECSLSAPPRKRYPSGMKENSPEWIKMRAEKDEYNKEYNKYYDELVRQRDNYYSTLNNYIHNHLGTEPPTGYEHMGYEKVDKLCV